MSGPTAVTDLPVALLGAGFWPSIYLYMAERPYRIKVNPVVVRNELAKRNISVTVLSQICGYSQTVSLNAYLREGAIPQKVADTLSRLNIPF